MEKFKILDHKADIRVTAFGLTKEELFSNSLSALIQITEPDLTEERVEVEFNVRSVEISSLLVDFLNEAIYFSQTRKESYLQPFFSELSNTVARGKFSGFKARGFGEDVKAATYHGIEVKKRGELWEATIIFDV